MKRKNNLTISEAIEYWIKKNNIEFNINEAEIKNAWLNIIGESIYNQTKKIVYNQQDKSVIFFMESDVLRYDFNFNKNKILIKLNNQLKDLVIENIIFK